MKKKNLDRIINFIREEMMTSGAPTNHTGKEVANYDPPLGKKNRRPTPLGRYRTRVMWMKKGES